MKKDFKHGKYRRLEIQIPSETWVGLYCELSTYVESKCFPHMKTHNEQGERLEETEDDFLEIVDDIEEIMSEYLCGESNEL